MLRIMILLVVGSMAIAPLLFADGPVLKTGQAKSYDELGNVVIDGSIKDDGYYRKGKAVRYTIGNDVVTDNSTGLSWQDDKSIAKTWLTKPNYDNGNYYDTSGDTATTYCNKLELWGGAWRLPTIHELQKLTDYGQYEPSTTPMVFQHIHEHANGSGYWSSTTGSTKTDTTIGYDHLAWQVSFYSGSVGGRAKLSYDQVYVRCVRGNQLVPSKFLRNAELEIVTDLASGLQWQDAKDVVGSTRRSWKDSIEYCENLEIDGDNDWRMPNNNELFSIIDFDKREPAINTVFAITHSSLEWSSTTAASNPENAWYVHFKAGLLLPIGNKVNSMYVRCVRGGEITGGSGGKAFIPAIQSLLFSGDSG